MRRDHPPSEILARFLTGVYLRDRTTVRKRPGVLVRPDGFEHQGTWRTRLEPGRLRQRLGPASHRSRLVSDTGNGATGRLPYRRCHLDVAAKQSSRNSCLAKADPRMEADHATARAVCGAVIVPYAYLTVDCGVGCVKDQSSSVGILDSCGAARTGAS